MGINLDQNWIDDDNVLKSVSGHPHLFYVYSCFETKNYEVSIAQAKKILNKSAI